MNRILVLAPHPDDEAIGCGGTLLRHVAQGDLVQLVFLTSGEKGGQGRPEAETIRIREREARAATRMLGIRSIEFWRLPDGRVRPAPATVKRLQATLEKFRPDKIYVTHDRERHPDHCGAARLACVAVAGGPQPPDILGYEVWTPIQELSEIVDISRFMAKKLQTIKIYRSQCAVVGFVEAARGLNRYRGEMHSARGGNYAEAFTRLQP